MIFLFSLIFLVIKKPEIDFYQAERELYNYTLFPDTNRVQLKYCSFVDIFNKKQGGAIYFDGEVAIFSCINSIFQKCRSDSKAGAIFLSILNSTLYKNCFSFCSSGSGNGCDGSSVFVNCHNSSIHQYTSYEKCPPYGQKSWYGICIFWYNNILSSDINSSFSHTSFAAGLMHCQSKQSTIFRYSSYNITEGNVLSFVNGNEGICQYGLIIDNNVKSGLIYCQASDHNITNFIFKGNTGPLTYMSICGKCSFYDCLFDCKLQNKGGAFYKEINCLFEQTNLNTETYKWDIEMNCNDLGINGKDLGATYSLTNKKYINFVTSFLLLSIFVTVAYMFSRKIIYIYKHRHYHRSLSLSNTLKVDTFAKEFY